jgi:wyosine [tRNA(Phe)-imidazoG37] synthetase (radical SAM superfamily)
MTSIPLKRKTGFITTIMHLVYGPIASWRLGKSLGIDLICKSKKICSFDCIYCQIQQTEKITSKQDNFISIKDLEKELQYALTHTQPDVLTFSGMGEPTLAKNMPDAIQLIRKMTKKPIAILTNSSLLYKKSVQDTLNTIDIITAKLDASDQHLFQAISKPAENITFNQTLKGIKEMRDQFQGKFALQMMFMKENLNSSEEMASVALDIEPDEVQINTPLRPSTISPLSKKELLQIEQYFKGLNTKTVYTSTRPVTDPLDKDELIRRRRPEP